MILNCFITYLINKLILHPRKQSRLFLFKKYIQIYFQIQNLLNDNTLHASKN